VPISNPQVPFHSSTTAWLTSVRRTSNQQNVQCPLAPFGICLDEGPAGPSCQVIGAILGEASCASSSSTKISRPNSGIWQPSLAATLETRWSSSRGNGNTQWNIAGVRRAVYVPDGEPASPAHALTAKFDVATRNAAGALRIAIELREQGFVPDVIFGHSGWGPTMYIADVFPEAAFLGYFEWFYSPESADMRFSGTSLQPGRRALVRANNLPILMDLASCDRGHLPDTMAARAVPDRVPLEDQRHP
jgi:hypothetical protein